ncbi:YceI family protein [Agriterribacter sp.]|uniref:YceI family protein n=1 Tax=Agriterribacter sp. TaxID=2821509 RepID=UPI002BC6E75B|nr:YceI family protein [Agriterribacter sp.]HRP56659.1 YceI family protein [Agriterribacter sp.]
MAVTKWALDPAHTEVTFKVRHLMITNVTGSFKKFNSEAETGDDDFSKAKVIFTVETASVTTDNDQRDAHLKSDDFFNAEKYPRIRFESTGLKKKGDNEYELEGNLTIRDVTKAVKLNVEAGGIVVDAYGQTKAGFSVSGKINRKDFGLNWSGVTEAGGIVVSDEVRMVVEAQYIKQ